jgi:outer membrane protein assembly factor BamB
MTLSTASLLRALTVMLMSAAAVGQSDDSPTWPEYRGPTRDGHAPRAEIPLRWGEKDNVRWKTPIRGSGWSSPVVVDGRIWLTSATEDGREMFAVAVDAESGEIAHDRRVFSVEAPESKNRLNSYASPSPTVEAGRVYVHFGTYGTACLDADSGKTLWERRDVHCDHMEGPGASPILLDDLLVVNMDGGDVQYVIALDKVTGETRWKAERSEALDKLVPDMRKAYSTPIVIEVDGARRLISSGAGATVAYDPKSGRELWKVRHGGFSMSSRPVVSGDMLVLNTGYMRARLVAVRTGGAGDVTDSNVVWTYRRGVPNMSSPLLVGERLYMVSDQGIASCIDISGGERIWQQRIEGQHCASPLYAAGRIYFFDREGRSVVIAPGDEYRELAINQLDDGCMASPAVVGDALVLRTKTHLYRIERGSSPTKGAGPPR